MSEKEFVWGLAGYGDLAEKRVAVALQGTPQGGLSGVWGRDAARTRDFAARHAIEQAHESLESLLDSGIDGLYVCTPPDSHAEYAVPALERGLHVMVEKPMAACSADCQRMIAAAQTVGRTLGVAYYRRAYPKVRRVKELIDSGLLGTVTWASITAHSWYSPDKTDPKHWRVEKARSGGGAVADIGVHRLDLLDYWLGPSTVQWSGVQHLVQDYDVEDGSSAVLSLENGAPVHTYFAWNSKTWLDRFEIVGSEAKIILDPFDGADVTVIRGRDRETLEIAPPQNGHAPCIADFVDAVRSGRAPLCDGAAGLRTNRLLEKIAR